jgi:hypothetical protein
MLYNVSLETFSFRYAGRRQRVQYQTIKVRAPRLLFIPTVYGEDDPRGVIWIRLIVKKFFDAPRLGYSQFSCGTAVSSATVVSLLQL